VQILVDLLSFTYLVVIICLAFYGFNSLVTALLYFQTKRPRTRRDTDPPQITDWPFVTIQLPIFNEKYTIERLLRAVTGLTYPRDRLQIQVLDDSTDDTVELVNKLVHEYKSQGVDIECVRRLKRVGYKAGALNDALRSATGEFIGIFDADFVPQADWLMKTIPMFRKSKKLGCVQTRWGHTNRQYNSLTRAEALAIDGHFVVEQTARARHDFFLTFNGTAGLWRRACIEDAGGWQWDTLTEDLDLSYRAQMRGWKIEFLPNVIVPAELPSEVEAFKKQQYRWAKGSFQVVRKTLPKVIREPGLSLRVRIMALAHLTGYFVHPLMVASLLLTLPVGLLAPVTFKLFPFSLIAGFGPPLLYLSAAAAKTPPLRERLRLLPMLLLMGFGISLSTSIAVMEGLLGKSGGVFVRTPKLNLDNNKKPIRTIDRAYVQPISPLVWAEILLGLYALLTSILLVPVMGWSIVPWMAIYVLGYFYIAGLNLIQHAEKTSRAQLPPLTEKRTI
jgi:cellulose synthase/poly-beta-1,6-N-acetylglucosamine synthase-like glycosyltransferase